ncbi:MAG: hypothetical protein ACOYOP_12685 [Microthrixaceae bacterium]
MPWGDLLRAVVVTAFFGLPLALTLVSLLDVVRRPQWAWALAERNQTAWIGAILLGVFCTVGGVAVCAVYWIRVRPVVAGAESGKLPEPRRRRRPPPA